MKLSLCRERGKEMNHGCKHLTQYLALKTQKRMLNHVFIKIIHNSYFKSISKNKNQPLKLFETMILTNNVVSSYVLVDKTGLASLLFSF